MAKAFGATTTTEDVLSGIDLHGKRILVTGVSAGLGTETARSLAAHGANVIGTARDLAKAEAATAQYERTRRRKGEASDSSNSIWPVLRASEAAPINCCER